MAGFLWQENNVVPVHVERIGSSFLYQRGTLYKRVHVPLKVKYKSWRV